MRTRLVAAVLAACALAVASCGDDDSEDAEGGGGGGATALRVVVAFDNTSGVPHAVEVEGNGVEEETETITDGSERLSLNLDAGEYKFYCPVGNHEDAGMVGTLTVR